MLKKLRKEDETFDFDLFLWLRGKLSSVAEPVPQTAVQVSSAEEEAQKMSRFLSGLPKLEQYRH